MKLSQLSLADYNELDNIPVINQDLSASGFTPTANTYYRHTGATTDTFTQGVIYLYDTAYHKLGESGGGMTLNKYQTFITLTNSTVGTLYRIFKNCKGNIISYWNLTDYASSYIVLTHMDVSNQKCRIITFSVGENNINSGYSFDAKPTENSMEIKTYNPNKIGIDIIYYNDTEIT